VDVYIHYTTERADILTFVRDMPFREISMRYLLVVMSAVGTVATALETDERGYSVHGELLCVNYIALSFSTISSLAWINMT